MTYKEALDFVEARLEYRNPMFFNYEDSLCTQFLYTARNALNKLVNDASVKVNVFDEEETHENCTVHILHNTVTDEYSIGWWENDRPPMIAEVGRRNNE